jgi:hypothetical protein
VRKSKYYWFGLILLLSLIVSACGRTNDSALTQPTTIALASGTPLPVTAAGETPTQIPVPTATPTLHPLQIEAMGISRADILIEMCWIPANYSRYYVSYLSEGLKIYALMTVPNGEQPPTGWPVIIFNHGYIPPTVYRTTERYIAYVDLIARNGYIVFRSDYRGHDRSEGEPGGAYSNPGYTVDVLNAVASLKRYPAADPNRIGMGDIPWAGTLPCARWSSPRTSRPA